MSNSKLLDVETSQSMTSELECALTPWLKSEERISLKNDNGLDQDLWTVL